MCRRTSDVVSLSFANLAQPKNHARPTKDYPHAVHKLCTAIAHKALFCRVLRAAERSVERLIRMVEHPRSCIRQRIARMVPALGSREIAGSPGVVLPEEAYELLAVTLRAARAGAGAARIARRGVAGRAARPRPRVGLAGRVARGQGAAARVLAARAGSVERRGAGRGRRRRLGPRGVARSGSLAVAQDRRGGARRGRHGAPRAARRGRGVRRVGDHPRANTHHRVHLEPGGVRARARSARPGASG